MNKPAFTEQDGHQLAADMLRELSAHWYARDDDTLPEEELGTLWLADNSDVLRRYLATVRDSGSAQLERGFLGVLTDFIGRSVEDCGPNPDYYEKPLSKPDTHGTSDR